MGWRRSRPRRRHRAKRGDYRTELPRGGRAHFIPKKAGALIPEKKAIPDNPLTVGAPGEVVREIDADARVMLAFAAASYVANGRRFAAECAAA